MLQLTDASQQTEWYFLDEKVVRFAKDIKVGDSIAMSFDTFQDEGKTKKKITYLNKEADGGGSADAAAPGAGAPAEVVSKYQKKEGFKPYGAKGKRESEKITRLSVLSSVSNIVSALIEAEAFDVKDLDTVVGVTDDLFTQALERVNKDLPEDES